MKLKIFTLRLNPTTGLFDEGELASFQLGKDVIEVSEHFLVHERTPTLLLVLRYRELPDGGGGARHSPEAARKDWRAELDAQGQRVYDEFRLWRGRKAKHDGLPPYLILNNRELAEFAMRRPWQPQRQHRVPPCELTTQARGLASTDVRPAPRS